MKFSIHKFEAEILGENIIIKELTKSEFEKIIKVIEKLGFKRDLKAEEEIKELHLSDFSDSNKSVFMAYGNKDDEAYVEYGPKLKIGSIRLKSGKMNGKELIEIISENQ